MEKKKEFVFNTQWALQVALAAIAILLSAFLGIDGIIIAFIGGVYILCFVLFVPVAFGFECESITQKFVFRKKLHDLCNLAEVKEAIASFSIYPRGYYYNIKFSGQRAYNIKIPKNAKTGELMKKHINEEEK